MIIRLARCAAAGTAAAAAMAICLRIFRHQALTTQAAGAHESVTAVVVTGSILAALVLSGMFFVVATAVAWLRAAWHARAADSTERPRRGRRPQTSRKESSS